jgi:hypothetical protein
VIATLDDVAGVVQGIIPEIFTSSPIFESGSRVISREYFKPGAAFECLAFFGG